MAEGQRERDWSLLSSLMSLVANCHRSPKRRAFKPSDFNPLIEAKDGVVHVTKENLALLRKEFIRERHVSDADKPKRRVFKSERLTDK